VGTDKFASVAELGHCGGSTILFAKRNAAMNWQEYYRARTISADEAAAKVMPGMRVDFPFASGTVMQRALAARGKHLDGVVDLRMSSPLIDPGWLGGDVAHRFRIEFELFIGNLGRPAHDRQQATYLPNLFSTGF
jgi:hypothetical protein